MRNPWKFFAGLAAGLILTLALHLVAFALILGVPTESSHWTFELNRKKQMLAKKSAPPRLLVVGGSASLFGISARELEKKTGMAALNLSTHAALGTEYILENAEAAARPGDTVLLVMEYELYADNEKDSVWLDYLVAREPRRFWNMSRIEQWRVFMMTPEDRLIRGLKGRINPRRYAGHKAGGGAYNAEYVDQWGDQTFHPRSAASSQIERQLSRLSFSLPEKTAGFALISSFCRWAQEHQINVLATYPNFLDQPELHTAVAQQNAERIANFYKYLGVPTIGDYTDVLLPSDQFFDTVYHLTDVAALNRTDRLAEKLMPFLSSTNGAFRNE